MTIQNNFPTTRFQGSKRKIIAWIWENISEFNFNSTLDVFGGTGVFAYESKRRGNISHYNDYMPFNHQIGLSIIENNSVTLSTEDINYLLQRHDNFEYPSFIQNEFEDLYYTDEENKWLDMMHINITNMNNKYKKSLAYSALFQAALAKRPYNLFHRANLYMRTDDVERSFGNKTTWDRSFPEHFREKLEEYNNAVFDNNKNNKSYNKNVLNWNNPPKTDLVYIDSPYYDKTKKSNNSTNYQYYYHFLNGFVQYDKWPNMLDTSVKTKRLEHEPSPWTKKDKIKDAFEKVFNLFSDRIIVLSYNTAGHPSPKKLKQMLETIKENVEITSKEHQYALSTKEDSADEIIIIAYNDEDKK